MRYLRTSAKKTHLNTPLCENTNMESRLVVCMSNNSESAYKAFLMSKASPFCPAPVSYLLTSLRSDHRYGVNLALKRLGLMLIF